MCVCGGGPRSQSVAGTNIYMAPEVFSGRYDNGIDIWSLGVVIAEALVLRRPDQERHTSCPALASLPPPHGCLVRMCCYHVFVLSCIHRHMCRPCSSHRPWRQ